MSMSLCGLTFASFSLLSNSMSVSVNNLYKLYDNDSVKVLDHFIRLKSLMGSIP